MRNVSEFKKARKHFSLRVGIGVFLLVWPSLGFAQGKAEPWVKSDEVRHLYVLGTTPMLFSSGGAKKMGYPVLMYSRVKGPAYWIVGSTIYRWNDVEGRSEVVRDIPTSTFAFIKSQPLAIFVCDGANGEPCRGWSFVVPPFQGVQTAPPRPVPPALPTPAPPSQPQVGAPPSVGDPQVIPTRYAIYRK